MHFRPRSGVSDEGIFAKFVMASKFDLESVAREKIRMAGLKRVNLGKSGGE
jgi:sRNA-binding protein